MIYFALQLLEMCLKLVTVMVCVPPRPDVFPEAVSFAAEAALVPLPDAEVVPVTDISWPTWSASFEVLPFRA